MKRMPPIFVVHGALGSAAQMQPVVDALELLGTVHNVELPGHGRTMLPDGIDFGMQTFVHTLQSAVRGADIRSAEKPFVFGYSMGGYAALALESEYPGTFAGILTLGTKFAWTPAVAAREAGRLNASVIAEKIPKFAATLEARHEDAGGWELLLKRTATLLTQLGERPLLTRDSLARVAARTCIAVGERDDTLTAEEAREYAGSVTNARFELLPDVPHPIERVPTAMIAGMLAELMRIPA